MVTRQNSLVTLRRSSPLMSHFATALLVAALSLSTVATAYAGASDENAAEAHVLAKQAAKLFRKGRGKLAAELFKQAYGLDPDPGYLYSAARAEHQQGKLETAIETYEKVIRVAGKNSPFHAKAKTHLARAWVDLEKVNNSHAGGASKDRQRHKPKAKLPAAAQPTPTPTKVKASAPETTVKPQPGAWKHGVGWTSLVIGVLAAGSGAVIGAMAMTESAALDEKIEDSKTYDPNKQKMVIDLNKLNLTQGQLKDKEQSINDRIFGAWMLGGVGAVGLAAAGWMLATAPQRSTVALLPNSRLRGVTMLVRF